MGLSKASGGAATGSGNLGGGAAPASSGSGLATAGGYLSGIGSLASGIQKGGVGGGIQAAGGAANLYNKATGGGGAFSGLLGQAGQALNIYNGLTSGTPQGVVSGLASGAGLAASSGAASAAGASAGMVSALGTSATGIGAVLAIPAVTSGIGDLIMGDLFGMNSATRWGNEMAILRNNTPTSGITQIPPTASMAQGGFAALGEQRPHNSIAGHDFYNGHDIGTVLGHEDILQKASDLYLSGDLNAYNQYMQSLISG